MLSLAVLAVGQLWVGNRLVTYGAEVSAKVEEMERLAMENRRMRGELSSKAALSQVALSAEAIGFTKSGEVISVSGFLPVAERLDNWF
jgi:hypothetical protein